MKEGRFYLRNKGKELADAVRNSIDENIRKLFLKCILDGSLKEEAIEDLQSLAIHRIIVGSEEWLFLNNLLTKSDEDSSLRRETIYLLLNDISNGVEIQEFVRIVFAYNWRRVIYRPHLGGISIIYVKVCIIVIDLLFCLILYKTHELHNPPIALLSQDIKQSLLSVIEKEMNYNSLDEWRKNVSDNINISMMN